MSDHDALRREVTARYRKAKRRSALGQHLRRWRKPAGGLPGALIIGAQKAGTTSLFDHLAQHPDIAGAPAKEVHYFNDSSHRPESWYRSYFPPEDDRLRLEATPDYLYHPWAAARMAALLPEAKLIALLREPVSRALSHYWFEYMRGNEDLDIEAAFAAEAARIGPDMAARMKPHGARDFHRRHHSYAGRGFYAEQLVRYRRHFAPERMLVLRSEDLRADPAGVFDQVCDFLGVGRFAGARFSERNVNPLERARKTAPEALRAALAERFAPANAALRDMTGIHWEGRD